MYFYAGYGKVLVDYVEEERVMSQGFSTALKVIGIISGILIAVIGIYFLIMMISSVSGISSYYYDSGMSQLVVLYVFLALYIIIEGFVTFAVLFFMGSAGNYMRLKLQKDGLWGVQNLVPVQNAYYGYQSSQQVPMQQHPVAQPQAQPQEQPLEQPQPDLGSQNGDQENTVS